MRVQAVDIVTGERSTCVKCGEDIAAVVDSSSGCVDWGSDLEHPLGVPTGLDFGCVRGGGHDPGPDHTPLGFKILVDSKSYWERLRAL